MSWTWNVLLAAPMWGRFHWRCNIKSFLSTKHPDSEEGHSPRWVNPFCGGAAAFSLAQIVVKSFSRSREVGTFSASRVHGSFPLCSAWSCWSALDHGSSWFVHWFHSYPPVHGLNQRKSEWRMHSNNTLIYRHKTQQNVKVCGSLTLIASVYLMCSHSLFMVSVLANNMLYVKWNNRPMEMIRPTEWHSIMLVAFPSFYHLPMTGCIWLYALCENCI